MAPDRVEDKPVRDAPAGSPDGEGARSVCHTAEEVAERLIFPRHDAHLGTNFATIR